MKYRLLSLLLLLAVMAGPISGRDRHKAEAEIAQKLERAGSSTDSIRLLYNLFDLSTRPRQGEVARKLYDVAGRAGRNDVKLDMLRMMCNLYQSSDSILGLILDEAQKQPRSSEQLETVTFIKIQRTTRQARHASENERRAMLMDCMRSAEMSHPDATLSEDELNSKVLSLFNIMAILSTTRYDELLQGTIAQLETLIDRLPHNLRAIKNTFYVQAAMAYSDMEKPLESIEADRKLLKNIEEMQREYAAQGRPYRNYASSLYAIKRRMLGNAVVLSRPETDALFRDINALAMEDADVAADLDRNPRAEAYYYSAVEDWEKAVPLLKRSIEVVTNATQKRKLLRSLIKGARAMGDKEMELSASADYIKILEEFNSARSSDRYNELKMIGEINNLRRKNLQLELDRTQTRNARHRSLLVVAFITVPLLLLLVIALLILYRRTRHLSENLARSNRELKAERDNVVESQAQVLEARDRAQKASNMKTEFINNMSHEIMTPLNAIADYSRLIADCISDDKRPYLAKYAMLVDLNNDLVQRMVNDVLSIAEADNMRMKITPQPHDINGVCKVVVDTGRRALQPGVTMEFVNPDRPPVTVTSDAQRVEQVLLNLLTNGAKFTNEGSVKLDYTVRDGNIYFSVTDTGIGIPRGREEKVFNRFEKLGRDTQGSGLGLPVARLIARLLHGDVYIDRSYESETGTRMVFWIPLKYASPS